MKRKKHINKAATKAGLLATLHEAVGLKPPKRTAKGPVSNRCRSPHTLRAKFDDTVDPFQHAKHLDLTI